MSTLARSCGSCSLCCKVLGIIELDKPAVSGARSSRPARAAVSTEPTPHPAARFSACGS